jgi:hypothetical protein
VTPSRVESGLISPPPSPYQDDPTHLPCSCLPRNVPCLAFYAKLLISLILVIFGIYGLVMEMEDKCTFSGFITFVAGYWMPSPFNKIEL